MLNSFQWLTDGVSMSQIDLARIEEWIIQVALRHDRIVGEITYIFCSDEVIIKVNRQFLNHDYYTDVITFDNSKGRMIGGDIYISLDTVESNAKQIGVEYFSELLRVIVHGILHLCGINDKGPGEREFMESFENEALNLFKSIG